jgi:hypothetical protein
MHDITLNLAIGDVNLILEGLGNLPFARVYALVGKIQEQASPQVAAASGAHEDDAPASSRPTLTATR